jgi:hypothetical protein
MPTPNTALVNDIAASGRVGEQRCKSLKIAAVIYPAVEATHIGVVDGIEFFAAYATGAENGARNARRSF